MQAPSRNREEMTSFCKYEEDVVTCLMHKTVKLRQKCADEKAQPELIVQKTTATYIGTNSQGSTIVIKLS